MKTFFKYFIALFLIISATIFYFINTDIGKEEIKALIENHLSQNSNNNITIHSLDLNKFPKITIHLKINQTATMILNGFINRDTMDMQYHLIGDSLKLNNLYLKEEIEVKGKISGNFNALAISGHGNIFEGIVDFNLTYLPKSIKNIKIKMEHIKSENVLALLDYKPFMQGRANINAQFKNFSNFKKEGIVTVNMQKSYLPLIKKYPLFHLHSTINFKNITYNYNATLTSKIGTVTIHNGQYHASKKELYGEYTVHINDLSDFQTLLRHKYTGDFQTHGKIFYNEHNKALHINGSTKKFDGAIDYIFKNNNLNIKLTAVSLQKVLEQFSDASIISSKIYGTINYNLKEEIAIINTDLKETYFLESQFTNLIQEKLNTNILSDEYNKSSFSGGYKDAVLFSVLKIDNGSNYIYLTDTKLNLLTNNINSKFEMLMTGTKIQGKIYDKVANPQVQINTKMFTIYNEHFDNWLQAL